MSVSSQCGARVHAQLLEPSARFGRVSAPFAMGDTASLAKAIDACAWAMGARHVDCVWWCQETDR